MILERSLDTDNVYVCLNSKLTNLMATPFLIEFAPKVQDGDSLVKEEVSIEERENYFVLELPDASYTKVKIHDCPPPEEGKDPEKGQFNDTIEIKHI